MKAATCGHRFGFVQGTPGEGPKNWRTGKWNTAGCHASDFLVMLVVLVLLLLLFAPLVKCVAYGTHFCRCFVLVYQEVSSSHDTCQELPLQRTMQSIPEPRGIACTRRYVLLLLLLLLLLLMYSCTAIPVLVTRAALLLLIEDGSRTNVVGPPWPAGSHPARWV